MATSSIASFAGIGSGMKYTDLVNQLIQAESAPATVMQSRIGLYNSRVSAYKSYNDLLSKLETAAKSLRDGSAFQGVTANVVNATGTAGRAVVSASASTGAEPGSYAVQVLQLAQAEKLSGNSFAPGSAALGLSGDFALNGVGINVSAADTLTSLRDKINVANTGASPSGVSAAIVMDSGGAQRLVLTSAKPGAAGINLVDGTQGVARQLGWIDGTTSIKHPTSAGAQSDNFSSATAAIASQLGLALAPGPQTVTIGGQTVTIDLGSDSLTSIAAKISALTGIQASVQSVTISGATKYYLDVRNTTSFADAGNVLEQLGILQSGRSATTQQLQGAALTAGDASTPATASTLLTSLWSGGSAANAHAGDTLTISGTRGDGTTVNSTFTIGANSTVQDLLGALNSSTSGFGGSRAATATIDAGGHIVVTDGTAGQSALSVRVVAHNEGGGSLDLGSFAVTSAGRARQLVAGSDARFSVDGVMFTRPSNSVTDVIADTTLSLTAADPTATATVTVDRSQDAARSAVQSYVDAYNKLIDFIQQQQTGASDPTKNPPLYNDSIVRLARSTLSNTMLVRVPGAAPDLSTVGMAGISLTKDGHVAFDTNKFQAAFNSRFSDVKTLFMEQGNATNPAVGYLSSTSATQSGTYGVSITQAPRQAQVLGSGFAGTYSAGSTPDSMTVTDTTHGTAVSVSLSNGMTTAQIVDALNSAFQTPQARVLRTSATLNDAGGNTAASSSTRLVDAHLANGTSAGVAVGDTIGFSGLRPDGTAYTGTFTIMANSTFGDLVSQLQSVVGASATVSFANGQMTVQNVAPGSSQLTLALTANNQGGGALGFGSTATVQPGHGVLSVTASNVGGQLQLTHGSYGATSGIQIALQGSGTSQLGIAAGTVNGIDVQGTIGGFAATGSGQTLVGGAGTPVDGLSIAYSGTGTGAAGSVSVTQGLGANIDRLLTTWSETGGTISQREDLLNSQVADTQRQLDAFNARMEVRRQALLKEYLAMDTAVQKLQSQGNAFISAFSGSSSASSSSSIFG